MILPYSKEPFFTCYNYMTFPFNVIESNSKSDATKWMFCKVFNVQFDHTSIQNKFAFVVYDPWGISEGLTTSQYVSLQKKMMTGVNIDIVAFFIGFWVGVLEEASGKVLITNDGTFQLGIFNIHAKETS